MHLEPLTKQVGVLKTMDVPADFRMEGWVRDDAEHVRSVPGWRG